MKLFKIAFSNIKKRKSSAITLTVITTLAVLMLAMSLMILFGIGSFFDDKAKEFNTPHITLVLSGYTGDEIADIYDYANTKAAETEMEDVYLGNIKYESSNRTIKTQMVFTKESDSRTMSIYKIIDEQPSKQDNSIILPLSFKYEGFKSGGEFSVKVGSKSFDFKIYGFFEDVQFGSAMSTVKKAYITGDIFNKISEDGNFMLNKLISLNFSSLKASYSFEPDFVKEFEESSGTYSLGTYDGSKSGVTMFPTIMGLVLILVSVIIVVVALIIARFTIINNIEEDIMALGALKSVGFTSKQIIGSMVLQFLIIAAVGAVLGSVLSVALGSMIGNIISTTSGLLWSGSSILVPVIISVLAVMAVVSLITYFMARRSKSITPINALRQGLSNHNFKKNTAPFEKSKMPLNLNIAVKHFKGNLKNNITAFIMMIMFSFMTVLGFTLYHNFVVDTTAFEQMSGLEMEAISIDASEEFANENFDEIKSRENIRKTLELSIFRLSADGNMINLKAWEDIKKREGNSLVEGKYPELDNEISIPRSLESMSGKTRGDWITLEYEGKAESYLITGITQIPGNPACDLTKEGFERLKENFVFTSMNIYLEDNSEEATEIFMNSLTDTYGRNIYMGNTADINDGILGTIAGPISIGTYFIIIVEIFVICFVFFLMTNTIIRRKRKDSGIMKALGFTSRQLILQTLLSFLPIIIGGVLIGTVLGVLLTNTLLGVMFAGLVAKATFTIPALLTALSEIGLIIVCMVTVYLVSLKFKRIAPQKLIVE